MSEISRILGASAALLRLGWRDACHDRIGLFGRLLLFSIPVLIFATIWQATPLAGLGYDADRLAWYVMMTEAIVFSVGYVFREIEQDINSGAIEAALSRPFAYVLAWIAEEAGGTLFRLFALLAYGSLLAGLMTGMVPFPWTAAPAIVLAAILGAFLALLFQVVIGLLTAWVGTPAPAYWIWQKLVFVFGGLFIPLTLYPAWLGDIGMATPFAAILYRPASLAIAADRVAIAEVFLWQGLWLALALLLVAAVAAAATRRFLREGV